jgi:hypothetical protein
VRVGETRVLQSWRVSIIRKRGQYLGTVEAPNEKAAEAAAVAEFDLSDEQRRRLVVSERDVEQPLKTARRP